MRRAGVIPYCDSNDGRFYAFSLQRGMRDICDFGGRREITDKNIIATAIREYYEESYGIFGPVEAATIVATTETLELFMPVPKTTTFYSLLFHSYPVNSEVVTIVWLPESVLLTTALSGSIYKPIADLIIANINIILSL